MKKVLVVGIEYRLQTGTPSNVFRTSRQFSERTFEYDNMFAAIKSLPGVEAAFFPFDRILTVGRDKMNDELLARVRKEKPDLVFCIPYSDELKKDVIKKISETTTIAAWFSDDHWRFDNYSRYYAPYYSWVITTYSRAVERYHKLGITNVILSQWAADTGLYCPTGKLGGGPDVSFVGTWFKPRAKVISDLEKRGIKVEVYGDGWPSGRISFDKMKKIFSESRINLGLNVPPGFLNVNSLGRLFFRRSFNKIVPAYHFVGNFRSFTKRGIPQIKGRHFEIPACGGFLLTGTADNLNEYYEDGKEIVIYKDTEDLAEKIRYYLSNEDERRTAAKAGYERTIREHTYEHRFSEMFKIMGLIE